MNNSKKVAIIACVVAVISSILPWVSIASVFGTITVNGTDGDGRYTLILGIIAGLFLYFGKKTMVTWAAVIAFLGTLIGAINAAQIQNIAHESHEGVLHVSMAYGLQLCILSFDVAIVASIIYRRQLKKKHETIFAPPTLVG